MRGRRTAATLAAVLCALCGAGAGHAAPDSGFGTLGTAFTGAGTLPFAVASDSQDRPVVAGFSGLSGFVERFTAAGAPDSSFGTNGVVSFAAQVPSIAVDSQDRVLVVSGAGVSRLTASGAPDQTFGSGGTASVPFGTGFVARAVAADASDRPVVVAVDTSTGHVEVTRLQTDGTPDTSFGVVDVGVLGLASGAVGRIFVAGTSAGNAAVTAVLSTGSVDTTFGTSGTATVDAGGNDAANAVAVDAGGDIVVGGTSIPGTSPAAGRPFVARLDGTGALDASFGASGIAEPSLPQGTGWLTQGLALGPAGRIALAGPTFSGPTVGGGLFVLDASGALDGGYVSGGFLQSTGFDTAAAFDGAGGLLLAGQLGPPTPTGFVSRFVLSTAQPAVHVPASPVTAEATGPSGAAVAFSASADEGGTVLPVSCSPASGSTFPLGDTTVTCSTQDAGGATASASFVVRVTDTTPPVLALANVAVDATSPVGAAVSYTATATDLVDGAVPVSCTAPAGSTFAIGDTTVSCTATDSHQNTASGTFLVHVRGAAEQLDALRRLAASYPDLAKRLATVRLSSPRKACLQLEQFARTALRSPGGSAGAALAADARRIDAVLGLC